MRKEKNRPNIVNLSSEIVCFVLTAILGILLLTALVTNAQVGTTLPRIVSPREVPKIIRGIPQHTRFCYSGLCFFKRKLYASSNIGLLEFDGETLSQIYKWYDKDDVISGPWLDVANNSLWVRHEGLNKLIRYDGKVWATMELPRPKEGYTRGDILEGFRGTGTSEGFWIVGGGYAWRRNEKDSSWESVSVPQNGSLVRIIPLQSKMLFVMRHETLPFLVRSRDFKSDTIHYYEEQWKEVPNRTGRSFLVEQVAVVKDTGYILTRDGLVFRITRSEITKLEIPEYGCEAIVATTSGSLLVSIRNSGIYEYSDGWHKRFECPYSSTEGDHWAYLSESEGNVAFAITSKPRLHGDGKKYPSQTRLWISVGKKLKAVPI